MNETNIGGFPSAVVRANDRLVIQKLRYVCQKRVVFVRLPYVKTIGSDGGHSVCRERAALNLCWEQERDPEEELFIALTDRTSTA